MNQMTTLVRRELWEHRAIVFVPGVFGLLFVVAVILGIFGFANVRIDGGVPEERAAGEVPRAADRPRSAISPTGSGRTSGGR